MFGKQKNPGNDAYLKREKIELNRFCNDFKKKKGIKKRTTTTIIIMKKSNNSNKNGHVLHTRVHRT